MRVKMAISKRLFFVFGLVLCGIAQVIVSLLWLDVVALAMRDAQLTIAGMLFTVAGLTLLAIVTLRLFQPFGRTVQPMVSRLRILRPFMSRPLVPVVF